MNYDSKSFYDKDNRKTISLFHCLGSEILCKAGIYYDYPVFNTLLLTNKLE